MSKKQLVYSALRVLVLSVCGAAVAACTVGKDSVIFTTNTSVAVDVDTKPATLSIAYTRSEAVLGPTLENNAVLPVLSSVGVNAGAFAFGANHSFATGDAALVMSDKLTDPDNFDFQANDLNIRKIDNANSSLPAGFIPTKIGVEDRRRFFFGTQSNLGLAVTWSSLNVPEAVSLGFKRKELAYVPLIEGRVKDANGRSHQGVQLSSLLATADAGTRVGNLNDTGMRIGQLFATGKAATYLAGHGSVRQVLGAAIVPSYAEAREIALEGDDSPERRRAALKLLDLVYTELGALGENGDNRAREIRAQMDGLKSPENPEYKFSAALLDIEDVGEDVPGLDASWVDAGASGFKNLIAHRNALASATEIRRIAKEKPEAEEIWVTRHRVEDGRVVMERNEPVVELVRISAGALRATADDYEGRLAQLDRKWAGEPILLEAIDYYTQVVTR